MTDKGQRHNSQVVILIMVWSWNIVVFFCVPRSSYVDGFEDILDLGMFLCSFVFLAS